MMELKSKLIGLLGIVIIGVVFLNLGGITGNVVDDPCEYYYQKWGPESWFNTWDWYNENCGGYVSGNSLCGNDVLEAGEDCDTNELIECRDIGFEWGLMKCDNCQLVTDFCVMDDE